MASDQAGIQGQARPGQAKARREEPTGMRFEELVLSKARRMVDWTMQGEGQRPPMVHHCGKFPAPLKERKDK